ncbi:MAG: ThiF family adenylyltransferase [Bdellovibrionaceae bacterium]|nr:ThiF family adenylyltransferase [Pseudobdellovibrionaceae bacterium]
MAAEYSELFSRNLGLVTPHEQDRLKTARVAVAGLGGVGGSHALALARTGIGKFRLADFDTFEPANFNRQAGALVSTTGKRKTDVIRSMILDINPYAEVEVYENGVTQENITSFLAGVDVVMDGLDFYALPVRRLLFAAAEQAGIYVVTSGPIGFTTTLHVFGPGAMTFEQYFDLASCRTESEQLVAFIAGVTPALLQAKQVDPKYLDFGKRSAPSIGTATQMCAGIAASEAIQILLGRRPPLLAPRYLQYDPVRWRFVRKKLWFGNRGPLQRLKRRALLKILDKS